MTIESFNFYKGINRSKPKIYLDESELYSCEGYDLEYVGMLMSREPKRQGLLVDGPLLEHPPTVGPPPPPTPPTPPVPWTPPNQAAFWAWFKYNEGLGTAIIDYSPTATNGQLFTNTNDPAIEPNVSYFWGTNPGYGTETAAGTGCRNRRQAPSRDSSYCSMVAFIKPLGYGKFDSTQAVQLGHTSALNCLIVGWEGASSPHYWKFQYSAGEKTASLAATYGTWYCIYAYSQKGVNNNGLYIKSSGAACLAMALSSCPAIP